MIAKRAALGILATLFFGDISYADAQEADVARDDDVVAICKVQAKSSSGEMTGPKLDIGWQFDAATEGEIARDAIKIHDPSNILAHRTIDFVRLRDRGTTFFTSLPSEDRTQGLAILIDPRTGGSKDLFDVTVGQMSPVGPRILYSGSCAVYQYARGGANLMFQAFKNRKPLMSVVQ